MKLVLILAAMFAVGCGKSGSGGGGNSPFAGIWFQEDEAQELRKTGKMESLCPEVRKNPNARIVNFRLIDPNGQTFLYVLEGNDRTLKMGELANDGSFKMTAKGMVENMSIFVSRSGDVLTFHFRSGKSEGKMNYLRSSRDEARAYYQAQANCMK